MDASGVGQFVRRPLSTFRFNLSRCLRNVARLVHSSTTRSTRSKSPDVMLWSEGLKKAESRATTLIPGMDHVQALRRHKDRRPRKFIVVAGFHAPSSRYGVGA